MEADKKAVLTPIVFFSFFNFAVTTRQIRRYLYGKELTEEQIRKVLEKIPQIKLDNGRWQLGESLSGFNEEGISKKLWQKVRAWRWIFANVPFLREVYVTNTLAYDNATKNSDIDILAVAMPKRLWTARAILLIWWQVFGLRVNSRNKFGKFSLEVMVDEEHLDVRPWAVSKDVYLEYWLADITPVWWINERQEFRLANNWIKQTLPIAWRSPKETSWPILGSSLGSKLVEKILSGRLGDNLENWLCLKQVKIIKNNLQRLGVNPSIITEPYLMKLHFNDKREQVRDFINNKIDELAEN